MTERCSFEGCNKKMGLVPMVCRCQKSYCVKHRLPESHKCSYDFKTNGKEILKKNNPLVVNKKIISI